MTNIPAGAIVVGVDGSTHSARALREAVLLAGLQRRPLHLLHAYDPAPWQWFLDVPVGRPAQVEQLVRAEAEQVLARAEAAAARRLPSGTVSSALVAGDPQLALRGAGDGASLLVVGARAPRGRGPVATLALGSVSVQLAQHVRCPVVVTPPQPRRSASDRLVAGVEGTGLSTSALWFAFEQAALRHAPLTIVHCVESVFAEPHDPFGLPDRLLDFSPARLTVAEVIAGCRADFPDVPLDIEVVRGRAGRFLVEASARAAMVVVGAHRPGRSALHPGRSTSSAVLGHARCTVAVVPAADPRATTGRESSLARA